MYAYVCLYIYKEYICVLLSSLFPLSVTVKDFLQGHPPIPPALRGSLEFVLLFFCSSQWKLSYGGKWELPCFRFGHAIAAPTTKPGAKNKLTRLNALRI